MIRRGGRGRDGRGRSNARGRGYNYTGAISTSTSQKILCNKLTNNVFDHGNKAAADKMCTSMEKIVQYVSTNYGQYIRNEIQNKATVTITEPVHTEYIIIKHYLREEMVRIGEENIQASK